VRAYRYLIAALIVALIGAVAAWLLGRDPGLLLIERGGWRVETTLMAALGALLLFGALLALLYKAIRWPFRAWSNRRLKRALNQLGEGLTARAEGRPERALNQFEAASSCPATAVPALAAALEVLDDHADQRGAALIARARELPRLAALCQSREAAAELAAGRPAAAVALLEPRIDDQRLSPAAARVLIQALIAAGQARKALSLLPRLRRETKGTEPVADALETQLLVAALTQASSSGELTACWAEFSRAQREQAGVVAALARRAIDLDGAEGVVDEVEGVLKRNFSDAAVNAWASLPSTAVERRIKLAESWHAAHPDSVAVLVALATLNLQARQYPAAESHARQALAAGATGEAWAAIGAACQAQGDFKRAAQAYANALAVARGQRVTALEGRGRGDLDALPGPEVRDAHGIPRLPPAD